MSNQEFGDMFAKFLFIIAIIAFIAFIFDIGQYFPGEW